MTLWSLSFSSISLLIYIPSSVCSGPSSLQCLQHVVVNSSIYYSLSLSVTLINYVLSGLLSLSIPYRILVSSGVTLKLEALVSVYCVLVLSIRVSV